MLLVCCFFLPESDDAQHFAVCLMNAFWKLHSCQPVNPVLSPLSSIGKGKLILLNFESSIQAKTYREQCLSLLLSNVYFKKRFK